MKSLFVRVIELPNSVVKKKNEYDGRVKSNCPSETRTTSESVDRTVSSGSVYIGQ